MISSEAQNQSTIDNERIRQLFNTTHSTSILSSDININQMTPIVDIIFPEQASLNQCHLSTNDLKTSFDRFLLWNNNYNKDNSASSFCGEVTNDSTSFISRRQSTAHTSLRDTQHHNQQLHFHRPSLVIRPHITSSPIRLPSPTTLHDFIYNFT
ncbi:unnamed protein product [Adineta steineri]|uniref:Uncharacterized protein n=1 Tax=Adineta steineri TaxID=433720 RepID=A0A818LRP1_9BILA|nr:unnamed protein product [Adineta steineri]CAF3573164.1 unnamed protein product [Adineta steineri]